MRPEWEFEPPSHADPVAPLRIRVAAHVLRFALIANAAGEAVGRDEFELFSLVFMWGIAWGLSRRLRIAYWTFVILSGVGIGLGAIALLLDDRLPGPISNLAHFDVGSAFQALGFAAWIVAFALILMPGLRRHFTGRLRVVHEGREANAERTELTAP